MLTSRPTYFPYALQEGDERWDSGTGARRVLPEREVLSADATRLRDGLGLPLQLMPMPALRTRGALREQTLRLNRLIAGKWPEPELRGFLERRLPAGWLGRLEPFFKAEFHPLWDPEQLAELYDREPGHVARRWWRSLRAAPYWEAARKAVVPDVALAEIWAELPVGDFDVGGRGRDYTTGMAYFQAARFFGISCLLKLLGDVDEGGDGLFLDVLGGDGYVLRVLQATRRLLEPPFFVLETAEKALSTMRPGDVPPEVIRVLRERLRGALALVLAGRVGSPRRGSPRRGRFVALLESGVEIGEPFEVHRGELEALRRAVWLDGEPEAADTAAVLERVARWLEAVPSCPARILTNDLSPHMFYSAGTWGLPTREDAHRLSRTFRRGSLDGVLFAYGTHHVDGLGTALGESFAILRPGGRIVVHDFLDEGQVGRWFHEVVHRLSRTGHDFPHLNPIQVAVDLFLAGFRDVELFEMEDPFVFAVPEGEGDARDVACTYLLGMYGMTESLKGRRDRFEELVREYLSYPEIDHVPLFARDLVYVPRRAIVVSGRRPSTDGAAPLTASDVALAERLTALLTSDPREITQRLELPPAVRETWFRPDGTRWGVTPAARERWLDASL